MAFKLLFTDGFDQYTSSAQFIERWGEVGSPTYFTLPASGTGRNGGRCIRVVNSVTTHASSVHLGGEYRSLIVGFACKVVSGWPATTTRGFPLTFKAGATQVSLVMQSDGKLNLYRGTYLGTLLASGTTILTVGTWFYIELKCYMDDTNGEYELRINGNSEFSANTVDTRDDPDSNYASRVTFYNPYDTGDTYLDDIYILGDTANTAGGFLGDVSIETVMPNANGTQADFTRSAGASDWELVDEVPASDTDYLYSSTAADQVTVNFTDAGAGADIVAASLWTHCSIGSGGGRDIKLLCDSGATLDASASKRIRHDAALMEGYLVDPNTAAAWTLTNLNLAEFGIEIV